MKCRQLLIQFRPEGRRWHVCHLLPFGTLAEAWQAVKDDVKPKGGGIVFFADKPEDVLYVNGGFGFVRCSDCMRIIHEAEAVAIDCELFCSFCASERVFVTNDEVSITPKDTAIRRTYHDKN